jgi:hypothetical protein
MQTGPRLAASLGIPAHDERATMSNDDRSLLQRITELVDEEKTLRAATERPEQHAERIKQLEEQLDQCWDLLRQRRAKREFGDNPDEAQTRDVKTVERYIQ